MINDRMKDRPEVFKKELEALLERHGAYIDIEKPKGKASFVVAGFKNSPHDRVPIVSVLNPDPAEVVTFDVRFQLYSVNLDEFVEWAKENCGGK